MQAGKRGRAVKWNKRLKILRISKVIIPIALAVSLLFAGFAVFAREAENFVVHVTEPDDVKLLLDYDENFTNPTTHLVVPIRGRYDDATYTPNQKSYSSIKDFDTNLPNDIAQYDGLHTIFNLTERISFFSFSFYVMNDSDRAVDIEASLDIDEVTVADKNSAHHVDGATRVMILEGKPLLSEETYTIYKLPEPDPALENAAGGLGEVEYNTDNVKFFESSDCVFTRQGDNCFKSIDIGEKLRYTVVVWLEGWDPDCIDEVRYDKMKMSFNFRGY